MSNKITKCTFNLTEIELVKLKYYAAISDSSENDTLHKALALYFLSKDEIKEGNKICSVNQKGIVQQIENI